MRVPLLLLFLPALSLAETDRPITTLGGPVEQHLTRWWEDGTAAGNVGDSYDNRDGKHSDLNTRKFPQLARTPHPEKTTKTPAHWGAQRRLMPGVVFGNSSTAAPLTRGGSNIRHYYTSPQGLAFLYSQYRSNNLYIYPEHRDHDVGPLGGDGSGDVFATNTPYLIGSQGSSGSDQPFMRAIPLVLAAFRPKVKQKLTETRTLMPTLQLILRSCNKQLAHPTDYLSGAAHPTIFEGKNVDPLAMIQMAHQMTLESLPPVVQLEVIEEDNVVPGVDFFEPVADEKLADLPQVIARIYRSLASTRRMVISAEKDFTLTPQDLSFHWVVLRGDPDQVRITPLNPQSSRVEIIIPHHERAPIAPGSKMFSNRVDIGAFVKNERWYSAPAFVTSFSLANEFRRYDEQGRILERHFGKENHYVDPRIARPKFWRDVYHYDSDGRRTGWTRTFNRRDYAYTAEGKRLNHDGAAVEQRYIPDPKMAKQPWTQALIPELP